MPQTSNHPIQIHLGHVRMVFIMYGTIMVDDNVVFLLIQ